MARDGKRRKYDLTEITTIFRLIKEGRTTGEIARELGRSTGGISTLKWSYGEFKRKGVTRYNYLTDLFKQYDKSKDLQEVRQDINRVQNLEIQVPSTVPSTDRYTRLENAYSEYEKAIQDFIIEEVKARVQATIEENTRLKAETEKPKTWVNKLRESLGS